MRSLEIFLAGVVGRGGGSGWDDRGQSRAFAAAISKSPGLVALDVGANNGNWIRRFSENLTEFSPQYHLFECAPYCFEPLQNNANAIGNATIVKKAVSDSVGEITLFLPEVGSGLASVHPRRDTSVNQHEYTELTVPTVTIDAYMADNGIKIVDFLKIDVEGHELAILHGAKDAFDANAIRAVMFEFGSANVNSRTFFRDFWDFFAECDFKVFRIIPGGRVLPVLEYEDMLEYFRGATNYIAVHRSST